MSRIVRRAFLAMTFLAIVVRGNALLAHEVTYVGTVTRLEAAVLHVRTVNTATKKDETVAFAITRDTKVRRGERSVTFAEAAVVVGERVAVVVNHDAAVKNVATEVRLAAK